MAIELGEAARAYFADATLRASVDDLLARDHAKEQQRLPWKQAREFNRALLMAEMARTQVIDVLFELWEQTWGRHVPDVLGDYEEEGQPSLMPADVWREPGIDRYASEMNNGLFPHAYWPNPTVFALGGSVSLRMHFLDKEDNCLEPPSPLPDLWARQPEGFWALGAVGKKTFPFRTFADDPNACLAEMQRQADMMVETLKG